MKIFANNKMVIRAQIGAIGLLAVAISSVIGDGPLVIPAAIGVAGIVLCGYVWFAGRHPIIECDSEIIIIREPLKRIRTLKISDGYQIHESNAAYVVSRHDKKVFSASKADYEVA